VGLASPGVAHGYDEAIGLFLPGYAGPEHARAAIEAAADLLVATGHKGNPWLPVGVGVHTGLTFIGSVGAGDSFTDFTAVGDTVNTTARLASVAGAGEVLITEDACEKANLPTTRLERRSLDLKGKTAAVKVFVLKP
jgi:adenylate cyclase